MSEPNPDRVTENKVFDRVYQALTRDDFLPHAQAAEIAITAAKRAGTFVREQALANGEQWAVDAATARLRSAAS